MSSDRASPNGPRRAARTPPSEPDAGPLAATRLGELAHEMSNLLDGSLRWLALASRTIPDQPGDIDDGADARLDQARRQIDCARDALERMSGLVGAAMRPVPIGSPLHDPDIGISIGEAIEHAVDVIRPEASELGIELDVRIDPAAGRASAGPLYAVLLNCVKNAVESIRRCTDDPGLSAGGIIEIEVGIVHEPETGRALQIEILDDGHGIDATERPFAHGYTRKPGGSGIGLAIAERTIAEIGGFVTLESRAERRGNDRPGARLRISLPIPIGSDEPIGGDP